MMEENESRKVILSVLGVAILLVAVVGVSFAAFTYNGTSTNANSITTGTITMSYAEPSNALVLTDALPMTETDAKAAYNTADKVFTFTVTADATGTIAIPYQINIKKETGSTLLDSEVMVHLTTGTVGTDGETIVSGTTKRMSELMVSGNATSLRSGAYTLKSETVQITNGKYNTADQYSQTYNLRMWIASDYDASQAAGKTYKITVHVDSKVNPIGG